MAMTPAHEARLPGASGIPGWMLALGGMVLLMAIAVVLVKWLLLYVMYKKRIFLRV